MVVVEGQNVLHSVKRERKLSGRRMSEEEYVRGNMSSQKMSESVRVSWCFTLAPSKWCAVYWIDQWPRLNLCLVVLGNFRCINPLTGKVINIPHRIIWSWCTGPLRRMKTRMRSIEWCYFSMTLNDLQWLAKFLVDKQAVLVLPTPNKLNAVFVKCQNTIDSTMTSAEACCVSKQLASGLQVHRSAHKCLYNISVFQAATFAYLIYWWVSCLSNCHFTSASGSFLESLREC